MQVVVRRSSLGEQQPPAVAYYPDGAIFGAASQFGDGMTVLVVPDNCVVTLPGVGPCLAANWRSNAATIVNAEAYRRIQLVFPGYSQSNANQDQLNSMRKYGHDTSSWPQDAKDRYTAADTGWNYVSAVREASDALAAGMPLDPTDDSHWPTPIPPVYVPPTP